MTFSVVFLTMMFLWLEVELDRVEVEIVVDVTVVSWLLLLLNTEFIVLEEKSCSASLRDLVFALL